jgi:4'-phosphopantetheinyl transferase
LRRVLARYTGQIAAEIEFEYGPHGKPYLKNPGRSADVSFNLSHSEDVALVAVTRGREVGIDVERVKPKRDYLEVAKFYFSRQERIQLSRLPRDLRREAFFHGWARKEAFIKALGLGLAFPLDEFSVSLEPGTHRLLEVRGRPLQEDVRWRLFALPVDGPFTAALAVEADVTNVRFFNLTEIGTDE